MATEYPTKACVNYRCKRETSEKLAEFIVDMKTIFHFAFLLKSKVSGHRHALMISSQHEHPEDAKKLEFRIA